MGRGILLGVIWGALISVIALAVLSLNAPLPDRMAVAPAPVPGPLERATPAAPAVAPVPEPDTAPDPDPDRDTGTPAASVPLPAGTEFNRPPEERAAALPSPDQAPTAPPVPDPEVPSAGEVTVPPAPDTAPAPLPVASDRPAALTATGPDEAATAPSPAPGQGEQPQIGVAPTRLGLPQIETDPAAVSGPAQPVPPAVPVAETATDPGADRPAIEAFAADFDASETRPLMAIILIDDPAFGRERAVLTNFGFPVTFAIDPTRPDAAEAAALYRAAGFEVMVLADALPEGATATDAEVALGAAFDILPEAVAVLDTSDDAIQGNREVLEGVVRILAETGHGMVSYPRGLNVAVQSATRAAVPADTLFRALDAEAERATVITRYLDRAAFAAGQEGEVIVVGHTYSDTVTALFSWALGTRSESVALAPVSAVLSR